MVMSGCSRSGTSTDPMGKSIKVGGLGVRQEVSVHAPSQPAMTAQALKAMPTGPKRTQRIKTIPLIQRRRARPIVSPLSEDGCKGFKNALNITQVCSGYISVFCPLIHNTPLALYSLETISAAS